MRKQKQKIPHLRDFFVIPEKKKKIYFFATKPGKYVTIYI